MSIGRLIYRLRNKYGHGLRVAYYRDVVRPRILRTPAVKGLTDGRCEIHVLTSSQDWLNLVWTLKSFYAVSDRNYRLCIHDDGSMDDTARRQLSLHFPDARLIDRAISDREVLAALAPFPRCRALRETNPLSPKLFDFVHYLRSDRMLLLDSDVLFFSKPGELLTRLEAIEQRENAVNADIASAHTVSPEDVRIRFHLELPERFNSGLGVIHKESIKPAWIEEFLDMPGIAGHFWRIEQTLFALCSARFGVKLLADEYRVSLKSGIEGCVAKHYIGAVRHLMYREGMAHLAATGLLT